MGVAMHATGMHHGGMDMQKGEDMKSGMDMEKGEDIDSKADDTASLSAGEQQAYDELVAKGQKTVDEMRMGVAMHATGMHHGGMDMQKGEDMHSGMDMNEGENMHSATDAEKG